MSKLIILGVLIGIGFIGFGIYGSLDIQMPEIEMPTIIEQIFNKPDTDTNTMQEIQKLGVQYVPSNEYNSTITYYVVSAGGGGNAYFISNGNDTSYIGSTGGSGGWYSVTTVNGSNYP